MCIGGGEEGGQGRQAATGRVMTAPYYYNVLYYNMLYYTITYTIIHTCRYAYMRIHVHSPTNKNGTKSTQAACLLSFQWV